MTSIIYISNFAETINQFISNNNNNNNHQNYLDWESTITNSDDYFYRFSIVSKIICETFDYYHNLNYNVIIFTNLSLVEKLIISHHSKKLNFIFNQLPIQNNNFFSLSFDISRLWIIPDYRNNIPYLFHNFTNIFYEFYNNCDFTINHYDFTLKVDLFTFTQFYKILYSISFYDIFNFTNINTFPTPFNTPNYCTYCNNNVKNIKLQLSDLIFDIKHSITDLQYKNIMEKLSEI